LNPYINQLLANIPNGYGISTETIPALQISGMGSLSLTGNTLYLTVGSQSSSYYLYSMTTQQLATDINSLTPANMLQNGIVELLQLSDGQSNAQLPATLYIPSDPTYYVLGMMARMIETRRRERISQVAQLNPQAAITRILDWWGASLGIPRYTDEPDVLYAQRVIGMRFRPTQNNYSIRRLLKSLGYDANVVDIGTGQFQAQVLNPLTPPQGFVYSIPQITEILGRVKSAGYQVSIIGATYIYGTSQMGVSAGGGYDVTHLTTVSFIISDNNTALTMSTQ
jgi:hypothetical protein